MTFIKKVNNTDPGFLEAYLDAECAIEECQCPCHYEHQTIGENELPSTPTLINYIKQIQRFVSRSK